MSLTAVKYDKMKFFERVEKQFPLSLRNSWGSFLDDYNW